MHKHIIKTLYLKTNVKSDFKYLLNIFLFLLYGKDLVHKTIQQQVFKIPQEQQFYSLK